MDYYQILNLKRTDNPNKNAITKSYRKSAMKWHPDKWANKSETEQQNAEQKFKEINNAYSVLSDPEKKKMYDLYGEDGLKRNNQIPHNFSGNGVKIFFGNNNRDPFSHFFSNQNMRPRQRASIKTFTFKCSLEELYNGCVKKMKISEGHSSKTIAINIIPGTKDKKEIMYNWNYNNKSYKIKFIIIQKKHHIFQREGDNLIFDCNLNSDQIKNRIKITLFDLDSNEIPVILSPNEVYQNYQKVLIGKGMPIINKKGAFGDLIISFNII
jgi:DnaJ homolog subfamily B member 4